MFREIEPDSAENAERRIRALDIALLVIKDYIRLLKENKALREKLESCLAWIYGPETETRVEPEPEWAREPLAEEDWYWLREESHGEPA